MVWINTEVLNSNKRPDLNILAQIHKGGLFKIHGLFKFMDWNKREI